MLQLIFILLHCSIDSDRLPVLKNLLSDFTLREGEDKRVLAIIDIWDGEKLVQLEFFVCRDSYINQILSSKNIEKEEFKPSFSLFTSLKNLEQKIAGFQTEENLLKEIIKKFELRYSTNTPSVNFLDSQRKSLSTLEIELDLTDASFLNPESLKQIEEDTKTQLLNRHRKKIFQSQLLSESIDEMIEFMRIINIEIITIYSDNSVENEDQALLCSVNSSNLDNTKNFLNDLSNKVFLAAPSTQVFLFLPRNTRKSLFLKQDNAPPNFPYYRSLRLFNYMLVGLFTYDFLAVDLLIEAFKFSRDSDFKEAIETGEYGNSYKELLNELESLLNNKRVNLKSDFSGLTFTTNKFGQDVELYPEDLSHGELKRLSIYMWLKHKSIEDSIVLMDEIDLALHPDWQYQIVSDLVDWVPSNQYILATHSYELCQALTPSHVKVLEPKLTERRSE